MLKFAGAVLFLSLFMASMSYADCHRVNHQVVQHVQFQQAYSPFYNNQIVAPYAIPVAIIPNTFYQVLPELAYARVNQEIAEQAALSAARKAVSEFIQKLQIPNVQDPAAPLKQESNNGKGAEAVAKVQGMVTSKCIKCHGKNSESMDLSDISKLTREDRKEILFRIMTDDQALKMPKGNASVSSAELDASHTFVNLAPSKSHGKLDDNPSGEKVIPKNVEPGIKLPPKEEVKEIPKAVTPKEK